MTDDMLEVQVEAVEAMPGSVWLGRGVDAEGRRVLFAGEPSMLSDIAEALDEGDGSVLALVPRWAVLSTGYVFVTVN